MAALLLAKGRKGMVDIDAAENVAPLRRTMQAYVTAEAQVWRVGGDRGAGGAAVSAPDACAWQRWHGRAPGAGMAEHL